jgi:hypothetical protein
MEVREDIGDGSKREFQTPTVPYLSASSNTPTTFTYPSPITYSRPRPSFSNLSPLPPQTSPAKASFIPFIARASLTTHLNMLGSAAPSPPPPISANEAHNSSTDSDSDFTTIRGVKRTISSTRQTELNGHRISQTYSHA